VNIVYMPINAHIVRIRGSLYREFNRGYVRAYWQNNLDAQHFAAGADRLDERRYRSRSTNFYHDFPLAFLIAARAVIADKSPSPPELRRYASIKGKHCSSAANNSGAADISTALAAVLPESVHSITARLCPSPPM
jgi:hypothetical protein